MDQARAKDAQEANRAAVLAVIMCAVVGFLVYGSPFSGVPFRGVSWIAVTLIALDLLVGYVVFRSIVSVYKSQKL
jgi:hypothetical protein